MVEVGLWGHGFAVGEGSLPGSFIEPDFVNKVVVDNFKRTVTFKALIVIGKDFRVHETVMTDEDYTATDVVAGLIDIAYATVDDLEGHSGNL